MNQRIKECIAKEFPGCTLLENGNIRSDKHSDTIYVPIVIFKEKTVGGLECETWRRLRDVSEDTEIFDPSEAPCSQYYPFWFAVYMVDHIINDDVTDEDISTELSYWDDD